MAEITVGAEAIGRDSSLGATYTLVAKDNPANASGKITSIEIWLNADADDCEVATFFVVEGNSLSTRDTEQIGAIVAGDKRTFEVDLDVEAGDYIGLHFGEIEADTSGGAGVWYRSGDFIPCTNQPFYFLAGYVISLKGIGEEAVVFIPKVVGII